METKIIANHYPSNEMDLFLTIFLINRVCLIDNIPISVHFCLETEAIEIIDKLKTRNDEVTTVYLIGYNLKDSENIIKRYSKRTILHNKVTSGQYKNIDFHILPYVKGNCLSNMMRKHFKRRLPFVYYILDSYLTLFKYNYAMGSRVTNKNYAVATFMYCLLEQAERSVNKVKLFILPSEYKNDATLKYKLFADMIEQLLEVIARYEIMETSNYRELYKNLSLIYNDSLVWFYKDYVTQEEYPMPDPSYIDFESILCAKSIVTHINESNYPYMYLKDDYNALNYCNYLKDIKVDKEIEDSDKGVDDGCEYDDKIKNSYTVTVYLTREARLNGLDKNLIRECIILSGLKHAYDIRFVVE